MTCVCDQSYINARWPKLVQIDDFLSLFLTICNPDNFHPRYLKNELIFFPSCFSNSGFNQLALAARGSLVREGMYPIMLLLMARDYEPGTDKYNYFDFAHSEQFVILHHFPCFIRLTEHLSISGRFFHHLGLSLPEFAIACTLEILKRMPTLNYLVVEILWFLFANLCCRFCCTFRCLIHGRKENVCTCTAQSSRVYAL